VRARKRTSRVQILAPGQRYICNNKVTISVQILAPDRGIVHVEMQDDEASPVDSRTEVQYIRN
jgi:hypothetical protein